MTTRHLAIRISGCKARVQTTETFLLAARCCEDGDAREEASQGDVVVVVLFGARARVELRARRVWMRLKLIETTVGPSSIVYFGNLSPALLTSPSLLLPLS